MIGLPPFMRVTEVNINLMVSFRKSEQFMGISFNNHTIDSFALISIQSLGHLVQKFTTPDSI